MKNYNDYLIDLAKLISIKSEKSAPQPNKPFGDGVANALDCFLNIAKKMGFETFNYENYIGEVRYGKGEEIGIIGHVDVVPEGIGWNYPAYQLTINDDKLYGRGVADDKGPLLTCLYALKELKDSNVKTNKQFRMFIGCDEESGWADVKYFKEKHSFPEYGFSPDGNFPVSYAEKGMVEILFKLPKLKKFKAIKGGTVVNAVCAYACCEALEGGIDSELLKKHNLVLKDGNIIESYGRSAHGSQPQLGENALINLFKYFLDMGEDVEKVLNYILLDQLNISKLKTEQGYVTLSAGLINQTEEEVVITCDCRIPAPLTLADVEEKIKLFNIPFSTKTRHEPMVVEKQGWFVNTLSNAYATITGESLNPISQGGSTFARAFRKGCAFGPEFPGCCSHIHEPNEFVAKEQVLKSFEIYKKAIFDLAQYKN